MLCIISKRGHAFLVGHQRFGDFKPKCCVYYGPSISFLALPEPPSVFSTYFSVMPRGGGNNLIDQQTQTPGEGVTVALRTQLKNATRNIKNRWSSSDGATGSAGTAGFTGPEEAQSLLSKAADVPNDTPTHQPRRNNAPPSSHYPLPPPLPVAAIPPTSQLQRAINHTLQSESNMLSKPDQNPLVVSSVIKDRAETIC